MSTQPAEFVVAEVIEDAPRKPWGFWATSGFSLLVVVTFICVQTAVAIVAIIVGAVVQSPGVDRLDLTNLPIDAESGWLMATATWATFPICLGLVALFAKLRRGWSIREYLALDRVPWPRYCGWLLAVLLLAAASDLLTWSLGRPLVPEVMQHAYRTAYFVPGLWAAFLIAAPIFEETFIRGFMFRGFQASRLRSVGAVMATSLFFAALHVQYDLYGMALCGAVGLLLGTARAATGSTRVPIAMHAMSNLVATIEAHILT
jgi:membrane protease YdiL (CAAX protease family)